MVLRALVGTMLLGLVASPATADPLPSAACLQWLRSVEAYRTTMDRAMGGAEIEDVYGDLEAVAAALDATKVPALLIEIESRCAKVLEETRKIQPPADLVGLHRAFDRYHVSMAIAAGAIRHQGNRGGREALLGSAIAELIDVYELMLDVFGAHDCETGDTEVVRARILPILRERETEFRAAERRD